MISNYTSKSSYDLNALLCIANVLICGITIYLYFTTGDTVYTNLLTVFLGCLFAIENIGMLSYEKRRKNPFIIILVLVATVFYLLRIPTLLLIPSSAITFQMLSITVTDVNYALTFILLSNASMFLGFYVGTKHNVRRINLSFSNDTSPKVKNAIIIISIIILVDFFTILSPEIFGRFSGFIAMIFFNQQIIILFTFAMLAYHYDKISQKLRILFIIIFLGIIVLATLSGSRSGFLTFGMLLLFSLLAVKQKVMINKKVLLLLLIIIPISFIFFVSATVKRQYNIQETITTEHIYKAIDEGIFDWDRIMDNYIGVIFYRIGFLDYSTEVIANRQKFTSIVNIEYYTKSIIDNVLTPGFDVFDVSRVSYALSYVRSDLPVPSKQEIIVRSNQSDQLGIYGEYYALFYGFPALIFFCLVAFIFQKVFVAFKSRNTLLTCLYKAVILNLFYVLLNSFGMDWFALNIITAVITTFIFARFYVNFGIKKVVFLHESKIKAKGYVCKVIYE